MAQELILKNSPALLIIDMQKGFCHPNGSFAMMGLPTDRHLSIVPTIITLRSIFRDCGYPIIYTREGWNKDYSDSGILLEGPMFAPLKDVGGLIRGSWDFEIINELTPNESDREIVLDKTRNTAFWGTDLAQMLRSLGVNQLVATGVGTNVCVESTVRDAVTNGFHTVTVSDATATLSDEEHQASLKNLIYYGGSVTLQELRVAISKL